jgi:hypothetical protein
MFQEPSNKIKDLLHIPRPLITLQRKQNGFEKEAYYVQGRGENRVHISVIKEHYDSTGNKISEVTRDWPVSQDSKNHVYESLTVSIKLRCNSGGWKIAQNDQTAWEDHFSQKNPFPEDK